MGKDSMKCVDVEPYGKLYVPKTMFFRDEVGKAEGSNGLAYEMSLNMAGSHPIVMSRKTGKWFTLSWHDIVKMAVDAGIDEEGELEAEGKPA